MESDERQMLQQILLISEENRRTLRGNNGNVGLVGQVAMLQQSFAAHCEATRKAEEESEKKNVTWWWILDKLATPAMLAIIMLLINHFVK